MKRTFKRPDGTEETLEGTADELAAYEREQAKNGIIPIPEGQLPKPGILYGGSVDGITITAQEADWVRFSRNIAKDFPIKMPWKLHDPMVPYIGPNYGGAIWQVSCSTCGMINCGGHNYGPYSRLGDVISKTVTIAGNGAVIGNPDISKLS